MKFTKFGKALLMSALSAGVVLSFTSCVRSYTVGFLYVTGTVTAQSGNNGIISGFKIDHNTGRLANINGLPVASGGANPVRAVLLTGSRFLYVLNRGVNSAGNADCTTADPCQNANITQFSVGGNGILTQQETFFTQGLNPFRIIADPSGGFLYVLDHDSIGADGKNPATAANPNPGCALALGTNVTTCGDITAFTINQTTGRLELIVNAQVTAANGAALPYFPVPVSPVDFVETGGYFLTMSATNQPAAYPYTGGSSVFPYTLNAGNGQLTINQNSSQALGIGEGTAIVAGSGVIYVLDNEPITIDFGGASTTSQSQILPYTVGTNGALQAESGGIVPDDPTLSNPIYLLVESKGKFIYVVNQGNNAQGANAASGIAGYFLTTTPAFQLSYIAGEPFGTGAGPQCLVEDPSDQFVYSADFNDSSVTGRVVDPNSGVLNNLRAATTYALQGPATWCLIDGRTS
ncbi:MAG: beta-propeller fold lactonase family protein [Terracidiphilus sp.]|jgi:6-phosphogluconolactonase (cycloisomerase 2 family)